MELRRTPLFEEHQRLGGRLVPFAGWEMPVQYDSMLAEAKAVRSACGLFDVSHMGRAVLSGAGALPSLLHLCTNAADRLEPGQAQYTLLCEESGGVLDDLIIYRVEPQRYLVVVNASNTESDLAWMRRHLLPDTIHVDRTDDLALLAVQGPRSAEILGRLLGQPLGGLESFGIAGAPSLGEEAWVARTGYTGEDGFEVFCPANRSVDLWRSLVEQPEVTPCGLGARDILRTEAGYPLYGHELDREHNPLEAGLGWVVRRGGRYLGAEALAQARREGVRRRLRGLKLHGRSIARPGSPVLRDGEAVGEVTSGTYSPNLEASIALAYLGGGAQEPGTLVTVEGERRRQEGEVVALPFRRFPRFVKG